MGARPVVLLAVAAGAVVLAAAAVSGGDGPRPASDSTAVSGRASTTLRPVPTTAALPQTTTTVAAGPRPIAEALGSENDATRESPGLVITNSGSATASVGGNVVSGGGPTATVITGDATAVGNSSSIRVP